jgi:cellulose synthase/poly-beta-1,6-N-acetylglucosamine synthase-like glycosyltransferase
VLNRIAVVVPAHNEETLLPGCLGSLDAARAAVPGVRVDLIVVADHCDDATAAVAAAAGCRVVTVHARNVGRARAAGVTEALRSGGAWVATTDADSRVPPDWLRAHLRHAAAGADVVVGTVEVDDWTPWAPELRQGFGLRPVYRPSGPNPRLPPAYLRAYESRVHGRTHGHVHGANLGFRPEAYLAAGGFPSRTASEDRAFVLAARSAGQRVVCVIDLPVLTSARPRSRVDAGFAGYLNALAERV